MLSENLLAFFVNEIFNIAQCNLDVCPHRCWWLCPPSMDLYLLRSPCVCFLRPACAFVFFGPPLFPFCLCFFLFPLFRFVSCLPSCGGLVHLLGPFVSLCLAVSCAGQFAFVPRAFASSGPHCAEWRLLKLELHRLLPARIHIVPWRTDQPTNLFH